MGAGASSNTSSRGPLSRVPTWDEFGSMIDTPPKRLNSATLTIDDFDYFEKLGEGGFGSVIRVRLKATGEFYAMKIMSKKHMLYEAEGDSREETLGRINAERNVCMGVEHPCIAQAGATLQTKEYAILIMELVDGLEMTTLLHQTGGLPEKWARFYVAELALALNYLHRNNILYRDIKIENVLIARDGHVKLVDMGLARTIECRLHLNISTASVGGNSSTTSAESSPSASVSSSIESDHSGQFQGDCRIPHSHRLQHHEIWNDNLKPGTVSHACCKRRMSVVGTPGYIAPEALRLSVEKDKCAYSRYGPAADMWALGALTYKLMMGRRPFPAPSRKAQAEDRAQNRGRYSELCLMFSTSLALMDTWSQEVCNLFVSLLEYEPSRRLGSGPEGFEEIKRHPFFEGIDWVGLEKKQVTPPFVPGNESNEEFDDELARVRKGGRRSSVPVYDNFEEMVSATVKPYDAQKQGEADLDVAEYFTNWDMVSLKFVSSKSVPVEAIPSLH